MTQYQNNRFICYIKHVFDNITWWFLDRGLQAAAPAAGAAGAAAAAAAPIKNVCKYKTRFNRVCLMSILSEMLSSIHMYIYIYTYVFFCLRIYRRLWLRPTSRTPKRHRSRRRRSLVLYIYIYIYIHDCWSCIMVFRHLLLQHMFRWPRCG